MQQQQHTASAAPTGGAVPASTPVAAATAHAEHMATTAAATSRGKGAVQQMKGWALRAVRGPSVTHSLLFGAAAGMCVYGFYYVYRGAKLYFFDTESVALQSRLRYAEKQELFLRELDEQLAAGYITNLVAEYDPVATRLPFKPLQEKYRF